LDVILLLEKFDTGWGTGSDMESNLTLIGMPGAGKITVKTGGCP